MGKLKTPILSLSASGSIAESITFQENQGQNIVRQKPVPRQPNSLPQYYQRWLYQDYVAYWHQQTLAIKRQWHSDASRYHLTGFALWMRYHLRNLPDIAGFWKLDDNLGPTSADSSRNTNTATIIGASPTTLRIDGALDCDGINDTLDCGFSPTLNPPAAQTIECFFRPHLNAGAYGANIGICYRSASYHLRLDLGQIAGNYVIGGIGFPHLNSGIFVVANTLYHIVFTYDGTNMRFFINGLPSGVLNRPGTIDLSPGVPTYWGSQALIGGRYCDCDLDNLITLNRALPEADALRHSLRRYPL